MPEATQVRLPAVLSSLPRSHFDLLKKLVSILHPTRLCEPHKHLLARQRGHSQGASLLLFSGTPSVQFTGHGYNPESSMSSPVASFIWYVVQLFDMLLDSDSIIEANSTDIWQCVSVVWSGGDQSRVTWEEGRLHKNCHSCKFPTGRPIRTYWTPQ